jgi:hypothetical protein
VPRRDLWSSPCSARSPYRRGERPCAAEDRLGRPAHGGGPESAWPAGRPDLRAGHRLAGALLIEQNDEWLVSHRYLSEESLALVLGEHDVDEELKPIAAGAGAGSHAGASGKLFKTLRVRTATINYCDNTDKRYTTLDMSTCAQPQSQTSVSSSRETRAWMSVCVAHRLSEQISRATYITADDRQHIRQNARST